MGRTVQDDAASVDHPPMTIVALIILGWTLIAVIAAGLCAAAARGDARMMLGLYGSPAPDSAHEHRLAA